MMLKKLFLTFSLLTAFTVAVSARSLVLQLSDSTKVYFLLDANPKMTFPKGSVYIDDKSYSFADVERFYISETDDPNGVEAVLAKEGIRLQGDQLVVGTKTKVRVFGLDGKQVPATQRTVAGKTIVGLERLPRGTYIVRAGNDTLKFNKK